VIDSKPVDFTPVIHFCSSLTQNSFGVWEDSFGDYTITIDKQNYLDKLRSIPNTRIFYSTNVKTLLPDIPKQNYENPPLSVISIGTFDAHNAAKQYCSTNSVKLITVPAPLSNDSFGTNRVQSQKNHRSMKGVFPSETIIDSNLISQFPYTINVLGLGEFIGLYFSIIDYYCIRGKEIPLDIIKHSVDRFETNIIQKKCVKDFYRQLGINLVFKCLIMRKNIDHQIGCGIDHLLGGFLEPRLNIPHGHAVYLGCILAYMLFPEWQKFGLDINKLISVGKSNKWLTYEIIESLKEITLKKLVNGALSLRPDRLSMLRSIETDKRGDLWEQLVSYTN